MSSEGQGKTEEITYKSQREALVQGISPFVPSWIAGFFLLLVLFEYFAETDKRNT